MARSPRPLKPATATRIVELVREGRTRCQVMEAVGCTRLTVERSLAKHLSLTRPEPAEDVDLGRLVALIDGDREGYVRAARLLGTTTHRIFEMLQGIPAECRPRENVGGRPSIIDVDKAIELREEGLSYAEVGRRGPRRRWPGSAEHVGRQPRDLG